jgi:crotonobetainyl-CoA:carnitine CoA-transferase CaiB-like acyl-CoA transferase
VLSLEEVFEDPQIRHNGLINERVHPTAGRIREVRPAAHFDGTVLEERPIAPLKGEHTDEILTELGIDAAERAALRADGILGP